jgi:Mn2+/Fe2+ NRAMP family transporter
MTHGRSGDDPGIDLRRLPSWAQYALSLTLVGIITAAAWLVGRNQPIPDWIEHVLIPALGWFYVVLLVFLAIRLVLRRPWSRRRRRID